MLEQQRRAPLTDDPLDDRRHLEVRVDRGRDPSQVPIAFQRAEEVLQISETHSKQA
jgi:hypothetical protein